VNRRTRFAQRTPLRSDPQRTAEWVQASRTPIARTPGLPPVSAGRLDAIAAGTVKNAARTGAGFSRTVKLAVRKRAGNGDPDMALCEACGKWLGRRLGQVHHRAGRGSGGCTDEVVNSCANAALLCGTALTGCHGLATAFKLPGGFVIKHGTTPEYDPRNVSIMLASRHGSGITMWLGTDGQYHTDGPQEAAA